MKKRATKPARAKRAPTKKRATGKRAVAKRATTKRAKATKRPAAKRVAARPSIDVFCRRLQKRLPEQEHLECPYCYGRVDDVRSKEHERFCDFQPGEDPIVYGFPTTHGRHQRE